VLGKLLFVKLEVDDKAETIPLELLGTTLTIGKLSDRITNGPRSRERRRKVSEGADVFAQDFRGGLPIVESKPDGNLLLESDVADENGPIEGSRPGLWERQTLNIDVGIEVGGIGESGRMIGIDGGELTVNGEGGWAGRRVREGVSGRFCLGFGLSFLTSRPRDIGRLAGPVIDTNGFQTVIGLCEVDVFQKVGGSGSRLSTNVSDLGDVGRRGRGLQGGLERLAVGKDDR
jgi:hypothetical protein